jgi:hypothetical protein
MGGHGPFRGLDAPLALAGIIAKRCGGGKSKACRQGRVVAWYDAQMNKGKNQRLLDFGNYVSVFGAGLLCGTSAGWRPWLLLLGLAGMLAGSIIVIVQSIRDKQPPSSDT